MELPSKLLEQFTANKSPKIEEHMLRVMDKYTHEEHLHQPLQTNNKQFNIAITFLTGFNGSFNVTNSNNKFYFEKRIADGDDFIQITIKPGAYEIESLNDEIIRIIIDQECYTESKYTFTNKPNFSILSSLLDISPQGPIIGFVFDGSIRNLLGFHETILYKDYNLSPNPVDTLSIGNVFIETIICEGMFYKGKRSGNIHNFTMHDNPGSKYIETFHGI